ncbi:MAG: aminopeptidase [Anaerolineales bacterium]|nr:aminopeptidase [Anaerolineales bacterium]
MNGSQFEQYLDRYAELIVKVGLNIQVGQRLLLGPPFFGVRGIPLESAPLVRLIVKKAYQAGARFVEVLWDDDQLQLIRHQYAPRDSFDEFPTWRTSTAYELAKNGDAILIIYAEDPDLLKGQDPELINKVQQAGIKARTAMDELVSRRGTNRVIVSASTRGWANKVFPDEKPKDRVARLWDVIFELNRVKQDDPISAWRSHLAALKTRSDVLNTKKYDGLRFTGPGTDLFVGLPAGHIWNRSHYRTVNGIEFVPNMPTEEIFTSPDCKRIEGVVSSTRPFNFGGYVIDGMRLRFSKGSVVEACAATGQQSLDRFLATDEGARRLGEVALVPHSSPISRSNVLFYNILYDENASSHLAFGRAFKFCIENGETMSKAGLDAVGSNRSKVHIDFMIGSGRMDVDGITAGGQAETLMRQGEWV